MSDHVSFISDILWDLRDRKELSLSTPDRVAVAQAIALEPVHNLSSVNIVNIFQNLGLTPPTLDCADKIIARLRLLLTEKNN